MLMSFPHRKGNLPSTTSPDVIRPTDPNFVDKTCCGHLDFSGVSPTCLRLRERNQTRGGQREIAKSDHQIFSFGSTCA